MHKQSLLALILLVSCLQFDSINAFCGGCGCNIWGCNCDFRPGPHCQGGKRKRSVDSSLESLSGETNPQQIFKMIDLNQDGFLVLPEVEKYLAQKVTVGRTVTQLDVPSEFDKIDTNKDGRLQSNEFDHIDHIDH